MDTEQLGEEREEVMKRGDSQVVRLEYMEAVKSYGSIYLEGDEEVNYKLGRVYSLVGERERAKKHLEVAIRINPNGPFYKKYMEYGQLSCPLVALESYNKGVEVLSQMHGECVEFNREPKLRRDLVSAYCALAEVYQTDLLAHPESDPACLENINNALELIPNSLEALEQQANYFLNKEQEDSFRLTLTQIDTIVNEKEADEGEGLTDVDQLIDISKLFMEDEQFQNSIQYLQRADKLDNNHPELIYLQAFCCFKLKDYAASKEILDDVKENKRLIASIEEDPDMKEAYMQLHSELLKIDIKPEDNEQEMVDEQEDWEEM